MDFVLVTQMMTRTPTSLLGTAIVVTAAFFLLTWPVWQWLWREWMGNDYYSHGLLIPPVSLFLVIQRFRKDESLAWPPISGSNSGLIVLIPSLLLYLYFLNNKAYYLAAFAMIGLIAGLVWTLAGTATLRKLLFPIAYLAFMVPLPFVERITLPLAMFTGVCSTGLVSILGMDITVVGNAVTLPNANLVIGAQCSGINSLIALLALTTLAAYLFDGPWWGRLGIVLVSVPLAMLGNILRVASLLVVAAWQGADAAFIFYHDYSGPIFFVLALLLLLPISRLLHVRTLRLDVI
jgi:exosortase